MSVCLCGQCLENSSRHCPWFSSSSLLLRGFQCSWGRTLQQVQQFQTVTENQESVETFSLLLLLAAAARIPDEISPCCWCADSNVLEEERCSNSRQSQRTKKVWKPFLSSSSSLLLRGFLTRFLRKWFSECVFAVRFGVRCTSYARFEQNDLGFHCTIDAKTILWRTTSFLPI